MILKYLPPQEQLYEINFLLHSLNNKSYAINKKYDIILQLNKMKKDILNKYK